MEKFIVHTPSLFAVDDKFDDERYMKVRIAVMHSGENRNHSSFSTKVIRAAKDTFANIPILANVVSYEDEDGNTVLDYHSHDMHIEENVLKPGESKMIYDERVVGVIPESNNFEIVHDDERDVDFAYVDGYIYREYGNYAADVLEAKGGITDVSAELFADEMSINAQTQVIEVDKMRMSGVTLLGEDVNPGMQGANAQMFAAEGDNIQSQLLVVMSELTEALNHYTALMSEQKSEEGGKTDMDKFNELLEKYGVTAEDIEFEYEEMSDEELEAKFAEVFGASEDSEDESEEAEDKSEEEETNFEDEDESEEEEEAKGEEFAVNHSVTFNGKTVTMSVSLQEKINALYTLVNDTYADDGTWYEVTVYDEDKYVIMVDYWNNKGYKQSYKVKKDTYTLVGDRVEVFARWLTQDEINALDRMKVDYAEAAAKLEKYEAEPKKMEILNSDDYSLVSDSAEFVALKEQKNHFDLSVEEVAKRADEILTNAAKAHKFSFAEETPEASVKPLPPMSKKPQKRFGSLFDGIIK